MIVRVLGRTFLYGGVTLGVGSAIAVALGAAPFGVPWLIGVGLVKLTLGASVGLMGAGAVFLRLDNRERGRLASGGTQRGP
jgi:hypothetical protein